MEKDIFWEVFRDTGDPLCWLMTRETGPRPESKRVPPERRDKDPLVPR